MKLFDSCAISSALLYFKKKSIDLDTRLELIKLYYKCGDSSGAALRAYKAAHGLHKDPFHISTISRLVQKFELHKTLHDIPKVCRPSLKEERKDNVENAIVASQLKILFDMLALAPFLIPA